MSFLANSLHPSPSPSCRTIGGGDIGASCIFPFTYKDITYTGCIFVDADDRKPWCSTLTDSEGQHVGGQGKWGHCPPTCSVDGAGQPSSATPAPTVQVEGSQSQLNNVKDVLPWFPTVGGTPWPSVTPYTGWKTVHSCKQRGINQRGGHHRQRCEEQVPGAGAQPAECGPPGVRCEHILSWHV